MKNKIQKIEIENESLYLKKNNYLGWKVVYPLKNDDGTLNWFNIFTGGSKINLLITIIFILILLGVLYEYSSNIQTLLNCFTDSNALEICKQNLMPDYMQLKIPS